MALTPRRHRTLLLALLFIVLSLIALALGITSPSQATVSLNNGPKAATPAASEEKSKALAGPARPFHNHNRAFAGKEN